MLTALDDAPPQSRVLLVFDATSPVKAWLKFRTRHARLRCGYKAFHMLDTLDQLVERHELVVFYWQTSHVGSPTNEWADLEADKAMGEGELTGESVLRIPRRQPRCFSVRTTRPVSSVFRWSSRRAQAAVVAWLRGASEHTAFFDPEGDVPWTGPLTEELERAGRAVRARRYTLRDAGRKWSPKVLERVQMVNCAFGCDCAGTWSHYQFFCPAVVVASARPDPAVDPSRTRGERFARAR